MELFRALFSPPRHWLLLLGAIWLGLNLSERRLKAPLSPEVLNNLVFSGMLGYLLGGRVFYAVEHFSQVMQSPLSLFSISGMFSLKGAMLTLVFTLLIYLQRHDLPLWPTLDALTPLLACALIGLSLANLASGDGFGKESNLPWAWELWGARRHPTQVYEFIASLATLGVILRLRPAAPGVLFLRFLALTCGWALFLFAFRGDSHLLPGGVRLEQVIAWLGLALSLWGLDRFQRLEVTHAT
jgi:phosphatidylglycerol:prolipoprotein diacylglycerol transferase